MQNPENFVSVLKAHVLIDTGAFKGNGCFPDKSSHDSVTEQPHRKEGLGFFFFLPKASRRVLPCEAL